MDFRKLCVVAYYRLYIVVRDFITLVAGSQEASNEWADLNKSFLACLYICLICYGMYVEQGNTITCFHFVWQG